MTVFEIHPYLRYTLILFTHLPLHVSLDIR